MFKTEYNTTLVIIVMYIKTLSYYNIYNILYCNNIICTSEVRAVFKLLI